MSTNFTNDDVSVILFSNAEDIKTFSIRWFNLVEHLTINLFQVVIPNFPERDNEKYLFYWNSGKSVADQWFSCVDENGAHVNLWELDDRMPELFTTHQIEYDGFETEACLYQFRPNPKIIYIEFGLIDDDLRYYWQTYTISNSLGQSEAISCQPVNLPLNIEISDQIDEQQITIFSIRGPDITVISTDKTIYAWSPPFRGRGSAIMTFRPRGNLFILKLHLIRHQLFNTEIIAETENYTADRISLKIRPEAKFLAIVPKNPKRPNEKYLYVPGDKWFYDENYKRMSIYSIANMVPEWFADFDDSIGEITYSFLPDQHFFWRA